MMMARRRGVRNRRSTHYTPANFTWQLFQYIGLQREAVAQYPWDEKPCIVDAGEGKVFLRPPISDFDRLSISARQLHGKKICSTAKVLLERSPEIFKGHFSFRPIGRKVAPYVLTITNPKELYEKVRAELLDRRPNIKSSEASVSGGANSSNDASVASTGETVPSEGSTSPAMRTPVSSETSRRRSSTSSEITRQLLAEQVPAASSSVLPGLDEDRLKALARCMKGLDFYLRRAAADDSATVTRLKELTLAPK